MESKKPQKGKRLTFSAIPIKKVAPGAIAPPEELLATSLTQIVPTMFNRRGAPEVEKAVAPPSRSKTARIKRPNIGQKQYELAAAEEPEIVSIAAPAPAHALETVAPALEAVAPATEAVAPATETVAPATEAVAPEAVPQPIKIRRPKSKYSKKLKKVKETIDEIENNDPYKEVPEAFVSQSRKGFTSFVVKTYGDFALPPKLQAPDMEACSRLGAAGEDTTRMYLYQQFVREYVRQASPYRGTLVYHGLGSGKTCSAIAAMEALYGTSGKKIIVMTPFSLQNNFLTEITFCGFKHFRLQNHWVRVELESDPTAALFAKEVMKIPDTFFQKQKRAKRTMAFYVPDFEQPANFDSLPDTDKKEIRDQIFSILRQRITFISYNGIRASQLKIWACSQSNFFDDAVIIIDEVHNLTRLMQGTIEPYLTETPRQKRRIEAEPVTPGRWAPKLCNVSANYKRAFLFYRLLVGAKNSKILALSGTPIVNFPEELGILANVLHGYNDCVEVTIPQNPSIPASRIEALFNTTAANHPRIDFYKITQTQSAQQIFISAVPEGYRKVFDAAGKLQGLEHVGDDAVPASIEDIFLDLQNQLSPEGITFSNPKFQSLPLLPPDGEGFLQRFINQDGLSVNNEIVLSKRLSGLISYYRGSKEEFMPRVTRDEYVYVPFTEYSLIGYLKARRSEQEEEEKLKSKTDGKTKVISAWAEVLAIAGKKNPSSYRFRSRAACNFVFPESVKRPFPDNEFDIEEELGKDVEVLGDQEADAAMDDAASQAAEKEDMDVEEEADADTPRPPVREGMSYKQRIAAAIEAIRSIGSQHLTLEPSEPGASSLDKYSPKYAEILRKIQASPGSALVYSQFRTLEGIGLFGVALEANGYIPIEILGSDDDPYFSPKCEQSFRMHFRATTSPTNQSNLNTDTTTYAKKRYILYSGEESRERRNLLINLFNARFDRLPPRISSVLRESGFEGPTNKKGDICNVISITGAGAEGLSLKNVRSVHVMEPFWNPVRTDQVKGRAVRICSHSELPVEDRTVEVFTYVSTVSQQMIAKKLVDESFMILDGSRTSDQFIQVISEKKKTLTNEILRVMKQSAVDCNLNSTENNTSLETIRCFIIKGGADEFLYDPRIDDDIIETERSTRFTTVDTTTTAVVAPTKPTTVRLTVRSIAGKQYIEKPQPDGSITLYNIKDRLFETPVGKRTLNPETGKYKTTFT
jgi:hypothetical protein